VTRDAFRQKAQAGQMQECESQLQRLDSGHDGSQAVSAMSPQRTIPAATAGIAAPAGPRRSSSGRPANRNTMTSPTTDSDHNSPPVPASIRAALQRIIAKLSCIAWLPRTNAATRATRR
jgi:hypothetical protein